MPKWRAIRQPTLAVLRCAVAESPYLDVIEAYCPTMILEKAKAESPMSP